MDVFNAILRALSLLKLTALTQQTANPGLRGSFATPSVSSLLEPRKAVRGTARLPYTRWRLQTTYWLPLAEQ